MKKVLFLLLLLFSTFNALAQKIIEGSLDFLKFKETVIEVNIDFSQTKFSPGDKLEKFLTPNYTLEDWENRIVPAAARAFIKHINAATNKYSLSFSLDNDKTEYVMTIAVNTLKNTTKLTATYTIKERASGKVVAILTYSEGGIFNDAPRAFEAQMEDAFAEAGTDAGKFFKKHYTNNNTNEDRIKNSLKDIDVLNYRFDFSLAKVDGVNLKEYYTMSAEDATDDPEEAFLRFAKRVEGTFILSANKNSLIEKGYKLDNKDDLPFEVVIYPMDIDDDGAHNILGIIFEKATQQEIARVKSRVGGGRMNDFHVLFLENLQKSGERFGNKLADDILDRAKGKGRFAQPQSNW